jgi:hypothetical protein
MTSTIMDALCASIDHQNAKTLMGQAADSMPVGNLVTTLDQQCDAQNSNERDNLICAQSTAGADEKSVASRPSVKRDRERPIPTRNSLADDLDEFFT